MTKTGFINPKTKAALTFFLCLFLLLISTPAFAEDSPLAESYADSCSDGSSAAGSSPTASVDSVSEGSIRSADSSMTISGSCQDSQISFSDNSDAVSSGLTNTDNADISSDSGDLNAVASPCAATESVAAEELSASPVTESLPVTDLPDSDNSNGTENSAGDETIVDGSESVFDPNLASGGIQTESENDEIALADSCSGEGNSYSASISPDAIVGPGEETLFQTTFTEVGEQSLGAAELILPEGFSRGSDSELAVESSLDGEGASKWQASWHENSGLLSIFLQAREDSALLHQGGWVSVLFKALTPADPADGAETYYFETRAWTDRQATVKNNPAQGTYNGVEYDHSAETLPVTVSSTIQGALEAEAVDVGSTVHVHSGTYSESFSITKEGTTLKSIQPKAAVIEGSVDIAADRVTLDGFTIDGQQGESAVLVSAGNDVTISGNLLKNSSIGVSLNGEAGSQDGVAIIGNEFQTAYGIAETHNSVNLLIKDNIFRTSQLAVRLNEGYTLAPVIGDTNTLYVKNRWLLAGGFAITRNNSDPVTEIRTAQELHNVRDELDGDYILMNDLDFNNLDDSDGYKSTRGDSNDNWNAGAGWDPIGDIGNSFTGTFNGDGHTIRNLFINRSGSNYQGLFGYTIGAALAGINFQNADVTGGTYTGALVGCAFNTTMDNIHIEKSEVKGTYQIGGLVGILMSGISGESYISRSSYSGIVAGILSSSDRHYIGGLVGRIAGGAKISESYTEGQVAGRLWVGGLVGLIGDVTAKYNVNIEKSFSSAEVFVSNHTAGGLVGNFSQAGGGFGSTLTISDSYFKGEVEASTDNNGNSVGGFLGRAGEGSVINIENSYNSGSVKGNDNVGGLIGSLEPSSIMGGYGIFLTVTDSYSRGEIEGTGDNVGGFIGQAQSGSTLIFKNSYNSGKVEGNNNHGGMIGSLGGNNYTFTACFFDQESTGQAKGAGNIDEDIDGITGLPTADMKNINSFNENWFIESYNPAIAPSEGWFIKPGNYPQLYWEHEGYPPDPPDLDPDPTPDPDLTPDRGRRDEVAVVYTAPAVQPFTIDQGSALTNIPGRGQDALITPDFVISGSASDLARALVLYNRSVQTYEANLNSFSAVERAVVQTEIAVAYVAIKALELSLAASSGEPFDLNALITAYQEAQAILINNRGLLTAEQVAEAERLLRAIAEVIGRLNQ